MSDDDADVVLTGIETLAAGGVQLEPIINDERSPVDGDGDGNGDRAGDER